MSILADDLRPHLAEDFRAVDNRLNSLGEHYKGKVRDLFIGDDEITMMRRTVSPTFDVVLSSIPCKIAILNAITLAAFEATKIFVRITLFLVRIQTYSRFVRPSRLPPRLSYAAISRVALRRLSSGQAGVTDRVSCGPEERPTL